jgi:DNA polymerase-1
MATNLLIIDAMALFHRCRNAIRTELTTAGGKSCRGSYVLLRTLLKELNSGDYTHVIAATEGFKSRSANSALLSTYKANRVKGADDMWDDLWITMALLKSLNIYVAAVDGQEADDTIATICHRAEPHFDQVTIYTCDSDMFQLINDQVVVKQYTSAKKVKLWDEQAFVDHFGISPEYYVEFKSMTGDSADNIPGVPGIGPKKAAAILNELGIFWRTHEKLSTPEIKSRISLNLELISLCPVLQLELPEDIKSWFEIGWSTDSIEFAVSELGWKSMEGKCKFQNQ